MVRGSETSDLIYQSEDELPLWYEEVKKMI